jgi:RNAse (barnase) inhibitor barstar
MESIRKNQLPVFPATVQVAEIDGNEAHTLKAFYTKIARSLRFPDYFGKNLDALYDCLTSLDQADKAEVVLLINHFPLLLSKEKPDIRKSVIKTFEDAEIPANRYDKIKFRVIAILD